MAAIDRMRVAEHDARALLLAAYAEQSRVLDLPVEPLAMTREAVRLLPQDRDARHTSVLTAHLQALIDAGNHPEAVVVADEVLGLAERAGQRAAISEVRTIMTGVLKAEQDVDAVEKHLLAVAAELGGTDDPIQVRVLHQLGALAHHRGELSSALQRFDEGAQAAVRLDRPWAPWGLECRLEGGLVAFELGDWDGALARLDPPKPPYPQPGLALFTAGRLIVLAGQGRPAPPGELAGLREWWPVDGLVVVLTAVGGMQLLANAGEIDAAVSLVEDAVAALDRAWGPQYQALVRLAALLTGVCASAVARCRAHASRPDAAHMWRALGAGGRGARRARVLARVPLCIGRVRDPSVGSPTGGRESSAAVARRL